MSARFTLSPGWIVWLGSTGLVLSADLPFVNGKWVDLTHAFSSETLYWPTAERSVLETEFHGRTPQDFFYAANRYRASEHGGTHLDAPVHFAESGQTVDELPLERLTGTAVVLDVSVQAGKDADYQVEAVELKEWEDRHGRLPSEAIVLFKTGYARRWPDAERYLGTAQRGAQAVAKLHFPGLSPEAAQWLVTERSVKAVGIDTASIDFGQSKLFETHRILSAKNIPIFENLAGLDRLPVTGAYVVALPMKIKAGSGAPLRIIAWVPNQG